MADIKYAITEHIGTISSGERGWNKELNLVSWNDAEPKYDLRQWSADHSKMGKGITLSEAELYALFDLLTDHIGGRDEDFLGAEQPEPEPVPSRENMPTEKNVSAADTDSKVMFYCKGKEAYATGRIADDDKGFIVLAGSKVVHETAPSFATNPHFKAYYENRNSLMADGTIVNYVFTRDVEFRSASAASAVILGKPSNGKKDWKLDGGKTLGDVT